MRPLSTRSVVLSLLLAVHPPRLSVRELIRCVQPLDISEATLRVALSRMVADGDLHRRDAVYRLGERLRERQRRQDEAIDPATKAWRGGWELAVVTATGRSPAQRAQLREELTRLRLAELREGVWLRPDNLRRPWPPEVTGSTRRFVARPDEAPVAGVLWGLAAWADRATALLDAFTSADRPSCIGRAFSGMMARSRPKPVSWS